MCKFCLSFVVVLLSTFSIAQKTEIVYLNPRDSNSNLYIAVQPPKSTRTGILMLIPGMFQKPQDVLIQTELPRIAARQGILTIIPTFKTGISSFGVDSATQASLLEILNHVIGRYKPGSERLFVGGFSIGGTCAIKYAQLALSKNSTLTPSAIFAIDSPLDFERMYNTMVREMRLPGTNEEFAAENKYMLKRFEKEFGGNPTDFRTAYFSGSPYSFNDTTLQAIRPLVNLPIRLYTEPDIQWSLKQGMDYSGMNAFDFAAMTNDLIRLGSKKVSLITTANKGFRKPNNQRHPHSWSIAEPNDLVKWLLLQK